MTSAARELHLTQSGVSQHIKNLEDSVNAALFDRVKQKLVPTAAGKILYEKGTKSLSDLERTIFLLRGKGQSLTGTVNIGMPTEFGLNIIIPLLSQYSLKHPELDFNLRFGLADEMNELILRGEIDFAFVDSFAFERRITTEHVYDEELELCIHKELLEKHSPPIHQRKYYEKLPYVAYEKGEPVLRMWFQHHSSRHDVHLNVRACAMDVQAVAKFICLKVGVGILPSYHRKKLQKDGMALHVFQGKGKPLSNTISVAYLRERTQSTATEVVLDWLRKALVRVQ